MIETFTKTQEVEVVARNLERGDGGLDRLTKRATEIRIKGGQVAPWEKLLRNWQINRLVDQEVADSAPRKDRLGLLLASAYAIFGENDPRYLKISAKITPLLPEK